MAKKTHIRLVDDAFLRERAEAQAKKSAPRASREAPPVASKPAQAKATSQDRSITFQNAAEDRAQPRQNTATAGESLRKRRVPTTSVHEHDIHAVLCRQEREVDRLLDRIEHQEIMDRLFKMSVVIIGVAVGVSIHMAATGDTEGISAIARIFD